MHSAARKNTNSLQQQPFIPFMTLTRQSQSGVFLILSRFSFQEHHEEDFFLYIAYSDENVYGN